MTLVQLWKRMMTMDYSNYELIHFLDRSLGQRIRRRGLRIGSHLAVAGEKGHRRIFRIRQGLPLVETVFTELDAAMELAEWLDDKYKDYWEIWESYPDLNVFSLLKWTVEDGIKIYEALQRLPRRFESGGISKLLVEAEKYVPQWTRGIG